MVIRVFHECSISEDAEDGKGTEQNSLRFQSLFLLARLDGLFGETLSIEDVDQGTRDEDDEEDEELHGCIITSAVEQVKHRPERKLASGIVAAILHDTLPHENGKRCWWSGRQAEGCHRCRCQRTTR